MWLRSSYRKASDEALIDALKKGKRPALEELYLRYEEALRYYFFRMTGQDAELARDLCQDVFIRVAEKCMSFRSGRSFKTWLYSLAHNMCKNHYRHLEVRKRVHEELTWEEGSLPAAGILAGIDEEDFRRRIDVSLAGLDPDRKGAFLLRHREGLSLKEIAEIQACPVGTVKSRLHFVHRFLARALADLKPEILAADEKL